MLGDPMAHCQAASTVTGISGAAGDAGRADAGACRGSVDLAATSDRSKKPFVSTMSPDLSPPRGFQPCSVRDRLLGMLRSPVVWPREFGFPPARAFDALGFGTSVDVDTVFLELVLARIIEQSSKHDFAPSCQRSHSLLYFC
jgi:hypothetical protein